jgi:hypothetical protein
MKNIRTSLLAVLAAGAFFGAHSHGLWIEPAKSGVSIHYGEYGNAEKEKNEKLDPFGTPEVLDAKGAALAVTRKEDGFYVASKGPLTAAVKNGPIYGEGDKATRYLAFLRYAPTWEKAGTANASFPIDIVPVGGKKPVFLTLKNGKPEGGQWVEVTAPNGWTKYFESDSTGRLEIKAPWPGLYVLHLEGEDKTAGTQAGKSFAKNHLSAYLSVSKP